MAQLVHLPIRYAWRELLTAGVILLLLVSVALSGWFLVPIRDARPAHIDATITGIYPHPAGRHAREPLVDVELAVADTGRHLTLPLRVSQVRRCRNGDYVRLIGMTTRIKNVRSWAFESKGCLAHPDFAG